MSAVADTPTRFGSGQAVRRLEDDALLAGTGRYTDDVVPAALLRTAFVRSPYPHARIVSVDTEADKALPGVVAVYTGAELAGAGVGLVLYPLSAFRAMNKAAENVYTAIRRDGTQQNVLDTMQTRAELYDRIDYHSYEQKLDALFAQNKVK